MAVESMVSEEVHLIDFDGGLDVHCLASEFERVHSLLVVFILLRD